MRNISRLLGTVAAVAALTLTVGCSSDDSTEDTGAQPANGALEKVSFLTGASILGREAYVYMAMEKGYFKAAGLDVEVQAGKGTNANLQLLQSGKVDFASLDITAALTEYGKGTFKDFTIINAVQQNNLSCITALSGGGISSPKDLAGKKIAYIPGGVAKVLFSAYAKLAGVDESKIQWVNIPAEQHPQTLAAGTVDAALQFGVGTPGIENAAKGRKAVVMPYTDYLTDLYGVGIGVTKKAATENPDKVRRFNEALLKGLKDAIGDPAEAGRVYAKYQKIQPEKVATAENTLLVPYVKAASGGAAIGSLDSSRVARNIAMIQGAGLIQQVFDPSAVISTEFMPKS